MQKLVVHLIKFGGEMSGKKKKKIKEEVLATGIFQSVELIPGMFEALKGLLGSENTWRSF